MVDYQLSFQNLSSNRLSFNYVVIVAKYEGQLVWVRKFGSNSWEIPGGHIEEGETPEFAAKRELWEETGAIEFKIVPICDFEIKTNESTSYNRLFFSDIQKLEKLPALEIEEILFCNQTPSVLTHGKIQLELIQKANETLESNINTLGI
jgi:8-oxo-dGTP diphosphatase